jgi:hypothetical protein
MQNIHHTYGLRQALRPSRRAHEINPAIGNRVDRRGRPIPIRIRLVNRLQAPAKNAKDTDAARLKSLRYIKTYGGPLTLCSIFDRVERRYIWNYNTDINRPITQFWSLASNVLLGLFDREAGEFIYQHPKLPSDYHDAYKSVFAKHHNNTNVALEGQAVANTNEANNSVVQNLEHANNEVPIKTEDGDDVDIVMQDLDEADVDGPNDGSVQVQEKENDEI